MKRSFTLKHNVRKSFGKIPELLEMPNLLEIQKNSYELFLQKNVRWYSLAHGKLIITNFGNRMDACVKNGIGSMAKSVA